MTVSKLFILLLVLLENEGLLLHNSITSSVFYQLMIGVEACLVQSVKKCVLEKWSRHSNDVTFSDVLNIIVCYL